MKLNTIYRGDALKTLKTFPNECVQGVVTSPPYWGLRDYGVKGQLGLENTPEEYVAKMVTIFHEIKRVLKKEGTLWLNLGDTYNANYRWGSDKNMHETWASNRAQKQNAEGGGTNKLSGLAPKNLVGIPWRVAFALRSDGWYLRQDIIWSKPNPMPESVIDRCTKAHEYIFLLSKSQKYYFDNEAIKERRKTFENRPDAILCDREYGYHSKQDVLRKQRNADVRKTGNKEGYKEARPSGTRTAGNLSAVYKNVDWSIEGVNKRSVWTIATKPYPDAHFATFPPEIPELCIKAGTKKGDVVLDPFMGSGTTAWTARKLGRQFVGIELNPDYIKLCEKRLQQQFLF